MAREAAARRPDFGELAAFFRKGRAAKAECWAKRWPNWKGVMTEVPDRSGAQVDPLTYLFSVGERDVYIRLFWTLHPSLMFVEGDDGAFSDDTDWADFQTLNPSLRKMAELVRALAPWLEHQRLSMDAPYEQKRAIQARFCEALNKNFYRYEELL